MGNVTRKAGGGAVNNSVVDINYLFIEYFVRRTNTVHLPDGTAAGEIDMTGGTNYVQIRH